MRLLAALVVSVFFSTPAGAQATYTVRVLTPETALKAAQAALGKCRGAGYQATVAELVPGDTPTLAAAALQDRVSALASEKKVSVQTTQVLKDEPLGPFRQVSLRVTASGELHDLADFLTALEFGPLRVSIPFIELSRRGAMVRKQGVGRTVSATIQVSGVVQGTAKLAEPRDVRSYAPRRRIRSARVSSADSNHAWTATHVIAVRGPSSSWISIARAIR